jgi:putative Mg2+ transporter-C (MgtC) family protein
VLDLPTLGWDGSVLRLTVAAALGGLIGLERELDDKSAGLRTHMLVAVGSGLFTIVSAYGFREFLTGGGNVVRADPARIAAQIVTGIGFIGAGVIFRLGFGVRGLTTAASLWLVAAIGMAAGAGYWAGAVIATVAALATLRPLEWIKNRYLPRRAGHVLELELAEGTTPGGVLDGLERLVQVDALRRDGARLQLEVLVHGRGRAEVLAAASELPGVLEARWA